MSVERDRCAARVRRLVLQDEYPVLRTHSKLHGVLVLFANDVVVLENKASGKRSTPELKVITRCIGTLPRGRWGQSVASHGPVPSA